MAVEADPTVHTVRLDPPDPDVPKAAVEAIEAADLVVLGPRLALRQRARRRGRPGHPGGVAIGTGDRRCWSYNLRIDGPEPDHVAVCSAATGSTPTP